MEGEICFEQYGNCPDELKVLGTTKELEDNIKHYSEANPELKTSIIKALAATQGKMFLIICAVKLVLSILEMS